MLVSSILPLGFLFGSVVAHASGHGRLEKRASVAKIYTQCKTNGHWAVTLDDGPYRYLPEIVALAKKYNIPLTHFVNGNNWACIYDYAEEIQAAYKAGHVFGNHGWHHKDAATISTSQFKTEVTKVDTALKKILGVVPNLHRFPYGSYNTQRLIDLVTLGYNQTCIWDVDSEDANGATVSEQKVNLNKGLKIYPDPAISLSHETLQTTLELQLPYLFQQIHRKGFTAVSLQTCLGIKAYRSKTGVLGKRDSTWTC